LAASVITIRIGSEGFIVSISYDQGISRDDILQAEALAYKRSLFCHVCSRPSKLLELSLLDKGYTTFSVIGSRIASKNWISVGVVGASSSFTLSWWLPLTLALRAHRAMKKIWYTLHNPAIFGTESFGLVDISPPAAEQWLPAAGYLVWHADMVVQRYHSQIVRRTIIAVRQWRAWLRRDCEYGICVNYPPFPVTIPISASYPIIGTVPRNQWRNCAHL
jgi:hypothetical protein